MFYILNELVFSEESAPDEIGGKSETRKASIWLLLAIFNSKIDVLVEKIGYKIVQDITLEFSAFSEIVR